MPFRSFSSISTTSRITPCSSTWSSFSRLHRLSCSDRAPARREAANLMPSTLQRIAHPLTRYLQRLRRRVLPANDAVVSEIDSGWRVVPDCIGFHYGSALDRPHFVLGRPDAEVPVIRVNRIVMVNSQRIVQVLFPRDHFPLRKVNFRLAVIPRVALRERRNALNGVHLAKRRAVRDAVRFARILRDRRRLRSDLGSVGVFCGWGVGGRPRLDEAVTEVGQANDGGKRNPGAVPALRSPFRGFGGACVR